MEFTTISRYRCCSKIQMFNGTYMRCTSVNTMTFFSNWNSHSAGFHTGAAALIISIILASFERKFAKSNLQFVSLIDWISNGRHLIEFNEINADFFLLNYLKVDFSRTLEKTATQLSENLNLIESNIDSTIRSADKSDISTHNNAINGWFDNFLEVSFKPWFQNYFQN